MPSDPPVAAPTPHESISRKANDYARQFNAIAEQSGCDLPISVIVALVDLFGTAMDTTWVEQLKTDIEWHGIAFGRLQGETVQVHVERLYRLFVQARSKGGRSHEAVQWLRPYYEQNRVAAPTPEPTEPTRVVEAARQLAGCPRHGDPPVCLACEAEEDAEPAWKNDAKSWTHRCSEKGRSMTWPDQEAQAIVNAAVLTPRRQLTVILKKDHGAAQADKDIAEVLSGRTSLCVRTDVSEMYFHQLRLRVEQDPALAEKITALTDQSDGALVEVKLGFENELLWPVGFLQDAWAKEVEIDKARQAKNNGLRLFTKEKIR